MITYISTMWTLSTSCVIWVSLCCLTAPIPNARFHDNLRLHHNLRRGILWRLLRDGGQWEVWRDTPWVLHLATGPCGPYRQVAYLGSRGGLGWRCWKTVTVLLRPHLEQELRIGIWCLFEPRSFPSVLNVFKVNINQHCPVLASTQILPAMCLRTSDGGPQMESRTGSSSRPLRSPITTRPVNTTKKYLSKQTRC